MLDIFYVEITKIGQLIPWFTDVSYFNFHNFRNWKWHCLCN